MLIGAAICGIHVREEECWVGEERGGRLTFELQACVVASIERWTITALSHGTYLAELLHLTQQSCYTSL